MNQTVGGLKTWHPSGSGLCKRLQGLPKRLICWGLTVSALASFNGTLPAQEFLPPASNQLVSQPASPAPAAGDATNETDAAPAAAPAAAAPATGGLNVFEGHPRLDCLAHDPHPDAKIPVPTPEVIAEYQKYIAQAIGQDNTLEIIMGRPKVLNLKQTPRRIQVGDENVARYAVVSPTELSVQGNRIGTTVLNLWFTDITDNKKTKLLSFLVRVLPDQDVKERLERAYKALEGEVNRAFPDSKICLILVGDKLGVTGQAKDIAEANQILRIVRANVLKDPTARLYESDPRRFEQGLVPAAADRIETGGPEVVNMLRVPGEQQVMLQVNVAEVDRAAARSIGLNFNVFNDSGRFIGGSNVGNLAFSNLGNGGAGAFAAFFALGGVGNNNRASLLSGIGGMANLPFSLDNGQIQLAINALKNNSYARYLAEPNLVTMNGQTAQFQAGGLFPVPVVSGFANAGLQGVNFIPIGVQLSFTPYVTDRDRIRLTISAEVSDRDQQVAYTIIDGAAIPSLSTRNFTTTVELREGQTLAVAGLIQSKLDADAARIPLLGDIPVLNRLFGYDRINSREQELVILITPQLVHPMEPKQVPPLPGSELFEPTDLEFYVLGRIESHQGRDYRSPIRTDLSRMKQFKHMEGVYLTGPHGPTFRFPDAPEHKPLPYSQMAPDSTPTEGPLPLVPPTATPGQVLPHPQTAPQTPMSTAPRTGSPVTTTAIPRPQPMPK